MRKWYNPPELASSLSFDPRDLKLYGAVHWTEQQCPACGGNLYQEGELPLKCLQCAREFRTISGKLAETRRLARELGVMPEDLVLAILSEYIKPKEVDHGT